MIVQRRRRRVWVGSQGKLGLDRRVCGDGNCDCATQRSSFDAWDANGTHVDAWVMDVARPRTVRSLCVLTFVCDVISTSIQHLSLLTS